MSYTNEKRIEYNKTYYANNKERIALMLLTKIECPYCRKPISRANLDRHTRGNMCLKRREKIVNVGNDDLQNQINNLKEQIAKLTLVAI